MSIDDIREMYLNQSGLFRVDGQLIPGNVRNIRSNGRLCVFLMVPAGKIYWKWPENKKKCFLQHEDVIQTTAAPKKVNNRGVFNVPEIDQYRTPFD